MRCLLTLCVLFTACDWDFPVDKFCLLEQTHCDADLASVIGDCSGQLEPCQRGQICLDTTSILGAITYCTAPCGDGRLRGDETCEAAQTLLDGPTDLPDGCAPVTCQTQVPATCGNGVSDPGEVCFSPAALEPHRHGGDEHAPARRCARSRCQPRRVRSTQSRHQDSVRQPPHTLIQLSSTCPPSPGPQPQP